MALRSIDLMIGDWYAFRGHPYQCTASDIASLAECEEKGAPTDISEIPLTPEILEKNGWFYPKQSSWMKFNNPNRELWGCLHTDGTFWLYSSGDCDKDENFAEIMYVHQLQHCLKLVGINKEITI